MNGSRFWHDDKWQREMRDRILVPGYYQKNGLRYILLDKGRMAKIFQRRLAVDTLMETVSGRLVGIEEKIVRWPGYHYSAFFLETDSCTVPGHESPGWMVYGVADYLLYCFERPDGTLDCWLIDFPPLQKWFWPLEETFPYSVIEDTDNKSAGRVVPIALIRRHVRVRHRRVGLALERASA